MEVVFMHHLYKKLLGLSALAVLFPTQVTAAIGVVDVNAIMRSDPKFQQNQVDLEKEHGKYEKEFQKIQEELGKEGNRLASLQATMDRAAFEKKKKELEEKIAKFQADMIEKKRFLDGKYQTLMSDLQDRVQSILKKIIEERKISYVLDQQFFLAINEKQKEEVQILTGDVIAQLNEMSRKGTEPLKSPAAVK
jgi:Skp family chaperone for outer membrane proteins